MRVSRASLICALVVSATLPACGSSESEGLTVRERTVIAGLINTGLTNKSDAYVRAETLRLLELSGDPTFAKQALGPARDDASPMVRAVALRVALAAKLPEADNVARAAYLKSKNVNDRRALIEAVSKHGSPKLRQDITRLGLKAKQAEVRLLAFDLGVVPEVRAAKKANQNKRLRRELLPSLGKYVNAGDALMAARALQVFSELGEEDRADALIHILKNKQAPKKDRVRAAHILWRAQIKKARAAMVELVQRDDADDASTLGQLSNPDPPEVIKAALVASVALGHEAYIPRVKKMLQGASIEKTLELLDAFGTNKSEDVAVTLKVYMRDARPPIRVRAIELYSKREKARAGALMQAMQQKDVRARKMLAATLVKRFPEKWARQLDKDLNDPKQVDGILGLLRDVISAKAAPALVKPLKAKLQGYAKDTKNTTRAASAAYLLQLAEPTNTQYNDVLAKYASSETRYAFLMHLLQYQAAGSKQTFRKFLYDPLFFVRLVSGLGLLKAYGIKGIPTIPSE